MCSAILFKRSTGRWAKHGAAHETPSNEPPKTSPSPLLPPAPCAQDPYHLPAYLASSIFLAEINMEALGAPAGAAAAAAAANTLYRDNMASLQRLVLFQFEDDDMVGDQPGSWARGRAVVPQQGHGGAKKPRPVPLVALPGSAACRLAWKRRLLPGLGCSSQAGAPPGRCSSQSALPIGATPHCSPSPQSQVVPKESSHFGVFSAAAGRVLRMDETPLYTEDRIGLRTLSEASRLVLARAPGLHMQISLAWLAEHVIKPYLAVRVDSGNTGSSSSSSGAGSSSSSGGVAGAGSS